MITIGMDVHVRNSYLHVTDDAGVRLRHGRCCNTMIDLRKFLGPLEGEARQHNEPIQVVLESTTNSRAIQRLLTQYGEEAGVDLTAEVLDARKIRIIAESVGTAQFIFRNPTHRPLSNRSLPSRANEVASCHGSTGIEAVSHLAITQKLYF